MRSLTIIVSFPVEVIDVHRDGLWAMAVTKKNAGLSEVSEGPNLLFQPQTPQE